MASLGDVVSALVLTFVSLFPVVNPIGDAPIFLNLTRQYPESTRKLLARKVAWYGFTLLAISMLFGSEILAFFGVTLPVVQIAGGLVLTATGWHLLNQPLDAASATREPTSLQGALEEAFYPLTLPITVGPGCISIAVALGAHLRSLSGSGWEHGYPVRLAGALVGMALVCLLVAVCYGNADRLAGRLGQTGTTIVIRLSAFILIAIGIEIAWTGLSAELLLVLERARTS